MDGYETCRIFKNDERTKDIPVIFLSAFGEKDNIVKAFDLGGIDYITKPFNNAELLARVFTHIELKISKDLIKKQNEELKKLNSSREKFFSIITHDLKSPFGSILSFLEMLVENFDEYDVSKLKEYISFILQGMHNTYKLLENLILWSRVQRGVINFKPENECLYSICLQTIELLNQPATNKLITIKNEIPENIFVNADRNMLRTILRNLISNAIKFTHKGGEVMIKAYTIADENKQKYTEIYVKDNGIGIVPEIQSVLFNITEHISTPGTEDEFGTGLGLILCKEFVNKHSGEIWVESEAGKGSKFYFTIQNNIDN